MKVQSWPAETRGCRVPLHVFFIYSSMMFTSGWEIEAATSGTDFYYPGGPLYSWLSTAKKLSIDCLWSRGRGFGNMHRCWKDTAAPAECINLFKLGVSNAGNYLNDFPLLFLRFVLRVSRCVPSNRVYHTLCVCVRIGQFYTHAQTLHAFHSGELCAHLLACAALQRINWLNNLSSRCAN